MKNFILKIAKDERGAVAVDWIVLTAGIVGIGVTMASTLDAGLQSAAASIFESIANIADSAVQTGQE